VLALSPDRDLIRNLLDKLRQRYSRDQVYLTTSVSTFLEAAHPQVNKGNAVRYLAETQLGLRSEQVMFVGDNFNDLEAITYAGLGVAMADAPEPVRAAAAWVAPSVADDGAAVAINHLLRAIDPS
jgi:hydroxymethylpyrimidine pyrophosphatase-like HAD family hydrolase